MKLCGLRECRYVSSAHRQMLCKAAAYEHLIQFGARFDIYHLTYIPFATVAHGAVIASIRVVLRCMVTTVES